MNPSKLSSLPQTSQPYRTIAVLTTALMTAFRPGQSPPPLTTAMRFCMRRIVLWKGRGNQWRKRSGTNGPIQQSRKRSVFGRSASGSNVSTNDAPIRWKRFEPDALRPKTLRLRLC